MTQILRVASLSLPSGWQTQVQQALSVKSMPIRGEIKEYAMIGNSVISAIR